MEPETTSTQLQRADSASNTNMARGCLSAAWKHLVSGLGRRLCSEDWAVFQRDREAAETFSSPVTEVDSCRYAALAAQMSLSGPDSQLRWPTMLDLAQGSANLYTQGHSPEVVGAAHDYMLDPSQATAAHFADMTAVADIRSQLRPLDELPLRVNEDNAPRLSAASIERAISSAPDPPSLRAAILESLLTEKCDSRERLRLQTSSFASKFGDAEHAALEACTAWAGAKRLQSTFNELQGLHVDDMQSLLSAVFASHQSQLARESADKQPEVSSDPPPFQVHRGSSNTNFPTATVSSATRGQRQLLSKPS